MLVGNKDPTFPNRNSVTCQLQLNWGMACLPVLYVKQLAVFLPVLQECRAEGIDRKGDI